MLNYFRIHPAFLRFPLVLQTAFFVLDRLFQTTRGFLKGRHLGLNCGVLVPPGVLHWSNPSFGLSLHLGSEWAPVDPALRRGIFFNPLPRVQVVMCIYLVERHGCFQKIGVTSKSWILIGFSIINLPFWGTPIFGNTHILCIICFYGIYWNWDILLGMTWWTTRIFFGPHVGTKVFVKVGPF